MKQSVPFSFHVIRRAKGKSALTIEQTNDRLKFVFTYWWSYYRELKRYRSCFFLSLPVRFFSHTRSCLSCGTERKWSGFLIVCLVDRQYVKDICSFSRIFSGRRCFFFFKNIINHLCASYGLCVQWCLSIFLRMIVYFINQWDIPCFR
jgi:hypothetical protein